MEGAIYFFILEIESGRAFKAPPAPGGRGAGGGRAIPPMALMRHQNVVCCRNSLYKKPLFEEVRARRHRGKNTPQTFPQIQDGRVSTSAG